MTSRRRRGSAWVALLTLPLLWPAAASAADSLRCGTAIVGVGATTQEVRAKCGAPDFTDVQTEALPRGRGYAADVVIWTYNFGPQRLMRLLRFRDGQLRNVQSDGYGFAKTPHGRCNPYDIHAGMSKYELLYRCGQPLSKTAAIVLLPVPAPFRGGRVRRLPNGVYAPASPLRQRVYRERWLYNFGSRYLQRKVTLEDGKVTDVEEGERGFDGQ